VFICFIYKVKDYSICFNFHWVSWEAKGMPCTGGCLSVCPWSALAVCDSAFLYKPRGRINGQLNPAQIFQLRNWKQSSWTLLDVFLARAGLCRVSKEQGGQELRHAPTPPELLQNPAQRSFLLQELALIPVQQAIKRIVCLLLWPPSFQL